MNDFTTIHGLATPLPVSVFEGRHLIGGEWRASESGETFERYSPSHGVLVSRSAKGNEADTNAAIAAARKAFESGEWSRTSGKARAAVLLKVADLIEQNVERIALVETLESGKPMTQARGEASGAADLWRYAASLARTMKGVKPGMAIARRAEAGTVWTNTWMDGFPELTFGGFKQSGQGREIGSYGLEEFLEVKTVAMRIGRSRPNWVNASGNAGAEG